MDLADALDQSGGFCDCEVALNVSTAGPLLLQRPQLQPSPENPWKLPQSHLQPAADKLFRFAAFGAYDSDRYRYAVDGELVLPAPFGDQSRKRQPQRARHFVGLETGLPTQLARIAELPRPMTTADLAEKGRQSGLPEFGAFGAIEAGFYFERCAMVAVGGHVGLFFSDVLIDAEKHLQLRIHKVIVR